MPLNFNNERDPYKCFYCGLKNDKVEAGGMWHCPNLFCSGPGSAWFRAKLPSYIENSDGTHSVDIEEWRATARSHAANSGGKYFFLGALDQPPEDVEYILGELKKRVDAFQLV